MVDSDDEDDTVGSLVTTFDTAVTFNEYITVNGGEAQDKTSTFNSPVTINVPATVRDGTLGVPGVGILTSLKVTSLVSNTKDDATLDRTAMAKNRQTGGDIIIAGNRITAAVFQWNQRGSNGTGQGYKIQTHVTGTSNVASNMTPDQGAEYSNDQIVSYGAAGGPRTGDMLLKGKEVGGSGSIGWILANQYQSVETNVEKFVYNNTNTVIIQWKTGVTNDTVITGGISAGMEVKIAGHNTGTVNGTWQINAGFVGSASTCTITIDAGSSPAGEALWSTQPAAATIEVASSDWKEWGVLGAQSIRTNTTKIGEFKVGINTVARAAHAAYQNAFVSDETNPRANLDVVGTVFISGKTIEDYANNSTTTKVETPQENAFLVGGASASPDSAATLRVNTKDGRLGINTTKAETTHALTVKGTVKVTEDATFEKDVAIHGGGAGSQNAADITTDIDSGTVNLFMTTGFTGLTTGTRPTQGLKVAGSSQNIEIGNVTTQIQNIKIGNTSTDSQITIGDSVDGTGTNASRTIIGGAYASDESKSVTQIDSKVLSIAGDVRFGQTIDPNTGGVVSPARRGAGAAVNFDSSSETFNFLSGNSVTSILNFGLNASDITIGSQGGDTKIRNNLTVDATSTFNASMTLCGGYANYSFTGYRAQSGSSLKAHTASTGNSPTRTVDIINVLAYSSSTSDGRYNRIDTGGTGDWGNESWRDPITTGIPAGQPTLPQLPVGEYYINLDKRPVDQNGDLWYNINDILLIDTVEQSGRHSEFVKVASLPRVSTTGPYYITVTRQPFGDLNTIIPTTAAPTVGHQDDTVIYKCTVQYDATWLVQDINATGTEADVYLAQFGGSLLGRETRTTQQIQNSAGQTVANPQYISATAPGDYVILTRDDSTNPDTGEILELKTTLVQTPKKLTVTNGCTGASGEEDKFVVDSVTGNVTMIGDHTVTGSLIVNGKCAVPYTDSNANKKLTITNGDSVTTFEVDTCTGNVTTGNTHGTVFVMSESFGSTIQGHSKGDTFSVYRHDPQSTSTTLAGPLTTIASAITTTTTDIEITSNLDAFSKGDLCAIWSGSAIELIQITGDPFEGTGANAGKNYLPTGTATAYPNGGRGSASNKIESTIAQAWATGVNIVKLEKYSYPGVTNLADPAVSEFVRTTKIRHDLPATTALRTATDGVKAPPPNSDDKRLAIQLENADLIAPILDYITWARIGDEWFVLDSVDGTNDIEGEKRPKQIRNPNTLSTTPNKLFGGGILAVNDDVNIFGGNFRMFGSDGITPIAIIGNDAGHVGDGSIEDPLTNYSGLTIKGGGSFYGDVGVYYQSCVARGVCTTDTSVRLYAKSGSIEMGETFTQEGKLKATEDDTDAIFSIKNMGSAGTSGTVGPKKFQIYQNNAIDSFGIEKYWTGNGGRRFTYVAFDAAAGIGQQQTNPLQVNNNYMINVTSNSNMVLYLPENAQTGDMIRFVELSGNLTYNTSLILRALKINSVATAIQGDTTGTKIQAGSASPAGSAWDSGELIIQTRNASFGLVYAGEYDVLGSASSQIIPSSLRGWWLLEL